MRDVVRDHADLHRADPGCAAADFAGRGVAFAKPLRETDWGMWRFSLRDPPGNLFIFHHDL